MPSLFATSRAIVLLPDPAGPSMAMIMPLTPGRSRRSSRPTRRPELRSGRTNSGIRDADAVHDRRPARRLARRLPRWPPPWPSGGRPRSCTAPPSQPPGSPVTSMPSGCSVTSTPRARGAARPWPAAGRSPWRAVRRRPADATCRGPCAAASKNSGSSSMRLGTSSAPTSVAISSEVRAVTRPTGSGPEHLDRPHLDVRAHPLEHRQQPGARGIQAHVLDGHLASRAPEAPPP